MINETRNQNQIKRSGKKTEKKIFKQIGSLKWNFRLHLSDRVVVMLLFFLAAAIAAGADAIDVVLLLIHMHTYTHSNVLHIWFVK